METSRLPYYVNISIDDYLTMSWQRKIAIPNFAWKEINWKAAESYIL